MTRAEDIYCVFTYFPWYQFSWVSGKWEVPGLFIRSFETC